MKKLILIAALASTFAGGPAIAKKRAIPDAIPKGAAVDCIPISQIRESRVRSDSVIDFRTGSKKWYRNTLPNSCPSLGFEERFSYHTSLSQLCSVDTIAVLQQFGGHLQEGPRCGLGKFQPVELAKAPRK
ncbi:hypothetical protein D5I55_16865 [Chakrabartia godavariana]|nr:hypothetical protein D5I55_16865 [Chakrabartia godavariana]